MDLLNKQTNEELMKSFTDCCSSKRWATIMCSLKPFTTESKLHEDAIEIWRSLGKEDFLEAFASHPRLGDRPKPVSSGPGVTASSHSLDQSKKEQSGIMAASDDVLEKLKEANKKYEATFDLTFIACASGKRADEILSLINERLKNDYETEILVAADEQRKITAIRLTKLINSLNEKASKL